MSNLEIMEKVVKLQEENRSLKEQIDDLKEKNFEFFKLTLQNSKTTFNAYSFWTLMLLIVFISIVSFFIYTKMDNLVKNEILGELNSKLESKLDENIQSINSKLTLLIDDKLKSVDLENPTKSDLEILKILKEDLDESQKESYKWFIIALEHHGNKRFKSAKIAYEKALKFDSKNIEVLSRFASLMLINFNDIESSKRYLEKILVIEPENLKTLKNLALLYRDRLRDKKETIKVFHKILEFEPNNLKIRYELAQMLEINDLKLAKNQYKLILESDENYKDVIYRFAKISLELKNLPEAKIYYQKAILKFSNSALIQYEYAKLLESLKEYKLSLKHYENVINLEPNNADALYDISYLLLDKFKEFTKAKNYYKKALKINQNLPKISELED